MLPHPDLTGCAIHGTEDWTLYKYPSGRVERRCLVCRRERTSATHNNGPRCRRGHLKTPWTWRRYGKDKSFGRCVTCRNDLKRQQRRERAA